MLIERFGLSKGLNEIRKVEFHAGLNLIVDGPSSGPTGSGNNVGKTTTLRMIDYCLGSEGKDIYIDPESGEPNEEVERFLFDGADTTATLELISLDKKRQYRVGRTFGRTAGTQKFFINDIEIASLSDYRRNLNHILFDSYETKPSVRQLLAKFLRIDRHRMGATLKFLGDRTALTDYELVFLFLFGLRKPGLLPERGKLRTRIKTTERDLEAFQRKRSEAACKQLIELINQKIESKRGSLKSFETIFDLQPLVRDLSTLRESVSEKSQLLAGINTTIELQERTLKQFSNSRVKVDLNAYQLLYKEARFYVPELEKTVEDLLNFSNKLLSNKIEFLEESLKSLREEQLALNEELMLLASHEKDIRTKLNEPEKIEGLVEIHQELEELNRQKGMEEANLKNILNEKDLLASYQKQLAETEREVEEFKSELEKNLYLFNKEFSSLSELLYAEKYILVAEEEGDKIRFRLTQVDQNAGAGKKTTQIAALDFAYNDFSRKANIKCPNFIIHDGLEVVHSNQAKRLLEIGDRKNGQYIVAALREKLPELDKRWLESKVVLELTDKDKFFRI